MEVELEIFYEDNEDKKILVLEETLTRLNNELKDLKEPRVAGMFVKCVFRVLRDSFRNNMDLTRASLKMLLFLLARGEELLSQETETELLYEIVKENPLDQVVILAQRVFRWEFKRLAKTVENFNNLESSNETSSQEVQSLNLVLAKQAQILTLLVLVLDKYVRCADPDVENVDEAYSLKVQSIAQSDLPECLLKCLDHSDPGLVSTTCLFLRDILSPQLATRIVKLDLFLRLSPCFKKKSASAEYLLLARLLTIDEVFAAMKPEQPLKLVTMLLKGLVKGHKESVLILLNLISADAYFRDLLVQREVELYLLSLSLQFLKKSPETVVKKKVLWNLLINMAVHPTFAYKVLHSDKLAPFFDFYLSSKAICCLKFLENVFHFAPMHKITSGDSKSSPFIIPPELSHYSEDVIFEIENLMRSSTNLENPTLSSLLCILSGFDFSPEPELLSKCRNLLLSEQAHPNVQIACLVFFNRTLFRPKLNLDVTLHNPTAPLVFEHFELESVSFLLDLARDPGHFQDDELKFQLLQFLCNFVSVLILALRSQARATMTQVSSTQLRDLADSLDIEVLSVFLKEFAHKNFRFLNLALRMFDSLSLLYSEQSARSEVSEEFGHQTRQLQLLKIEFYLDAMADQDNKQSLKTSYSEDMLDYQDYFLYDYF